MTEVFNPGVEPPSGTYFKSLPRNSNITSREGGPRGVALQSSGEQSIERLPPLRGSPEPQIPSRMENS